PGGHGQDRQEVPARPVRADVSRPLRTRPGGPVVPPGPIGNRPYRIVFVCTGNICRSPMAEVINPSLAAGTQLGRIDLVVALDRRHQQTLRSLGADPDRLVLLRHFDAASGAAADVPDPYYGDNAVFDECRDMIAVACSGLGASL